MRRPYLEDIENLRHNPKEPYKPVKALGLNADEKRLNGAEIAKPAAEKKKLVLDLDAEEPSGTDALEL